MNKTLNNIVKTGFVTSLILNSHFALATLGEKADVVSGSADSFATLLLKFAVLAGIFAVLWGLLGFLKNKQNGGSQETAGENIKKMWIGGLLIAIPGLILVFTTTTGLEASSTTTSILSGK